MGDTTLIPAIDLAATNRSHFPNESADYRRARNALLIEEIELRRQLERVAAHRRALPPGGTVPKDYQFAGKSGPTTLEGLFGDKQSFVIYSFMAGPKRSEPCPMCTSFMGSFEGKIPDIHQRVAIAFVARSPIGRLLAFAQDRGWSQLPIFSDTSGDYTRDYVSAGDEDVPGYNVFTRRDGTVRHFWGNEMSGEMADPGEDPRGQPEMDPLWILLDTVPEGRGTDWYPKLRYPSAEPASA